STTAVRVGKVRRARARNVNGLNGTWLASLITADLPRRGGDRPGRLVHRRDGRETVSTVHAGRWRRWGGPRRRGGPLAPWGLAGAPVAGDGPGAEGPVASVDPDRLPDGQVV